MKTLDQVDGTPPPRRRLDFNELEAWLRELAWWREWVDSIVTGGQPPSFLPDGRPATEDDPDFYPRICGKVILLASWVGDLSRDGTFQQPGPKLPVELARLIHYRYMAKTKEMGMSVEDCCTWLELSRVTYYKHWRRAMELLVMAVNTSDIEIGPPYSDCRTEVVPPAVRTARVQTRKAARRANRTQKADKREGRESSGSTPAPYSSPDDDHQPGA